jgi:hypothetical protein
MSASILLRVGQQFGQHRRRMTRLGVPSARMAFAIMNLLIAGLVLVGLFAGLPERWPVVDAPGTLIAALLVASSVALMRERSWSWTVVRVAAAALLALGLLTVGALTLTLSFLSGVVGPAGAGGVVLFGMVIALVLPYLVVYPAVQLVWVARRSSARS